MEEVKKGKERHLYLGNNTPEGFFSYYEYILGQREAEKIICIKGGPGTGKSTFMRKIGEELTAIGQDVDFMHCSADGDSLDGILIRDKKIAMVDGTRPHVVDPINPGAVDFIIHLGDYWNGDAIRVNKMAIINKSEEISYIYKLAYNYFGAAGKIHDNIGKILNNYVKQEEAYKRFANLIGNKLAHKEVTANQGKFKKYFASAITAKGYVNHIDSVTADCKEIYMVETEIGVSISKMLELFADSVLFRGFDVEAYYCPMAPRDKPEHIVVPELGIAIVSSNEIHSLGNGNNENPKQPWFTYKANRSHLTLTEKETLEDCGKAFKDLMNKGMDCLKTAKREHDTLENYYIPNMDFTKIEELRKLTLESICCK